MPGSCRDSIAVRPVHANDGPVPSTQLDRVKDVRNGVAKIPYAVRASIDEAEHSLGFPSKVSME